MASASGFFTTRSSRVLGAFLLVQATLFHATSRSENVPAAPPLRTFPFEVGGWRVTREGYVDAETQAVLRADDTLSRAYGKADRDRGASLFVAYFKTQRTGQAPHSPKNCLPGSGWEPTSIGTIAIEAGGETITVNRYVIAKGDVRSVVLYWYQTQNRVIASEYMAKVHLVTDAIRYNRTDTALVRVVVPVRGSDEDMATAAAIDFVKSAYPALKKQLPA